MNITKLNICNFLTIGEASFDLDGRGLMLIQGENEDDTSAKSNGAGKSSIVDALCWALYGTTAREVTGDDVVNETAKKNCSVSVVLEDGDDAYTIKRYRKDKTMKNQLIVHRIPNYGVAVDLSKGTDKETQEVVNKIMGCSLDVFVGSIYAGQEKMPDLPNMTDKQLKLLIEEAAGVEELATAYAEARTRSTQVNLELLGAETEANVLTAQLATSEAGLLKAQTDFDQFEANRKDRAREELKAVSPIQDKINEEKAKVASIDAPALSKRKTELESILAKRNVEEQGLRELAIAERSISDKVTRFRSTTEIEKGALKRQEDSIASINSQVGTPCGSCGKVYCEHDLEEAVNARNAALTLQKKSLLQAATGLRDALAEHEVAKAKVATFQASMSDVTAVSEEMRKIDTQLRLSTMFDEAQAKLLAAIDEVKNRAKTKMSEPNPWKNLIETQVEQIEALKVKIHNVQTSIATLEDKAEVYMDAVKVFGPAGVRAHILDTVTPFLNDKTGEYLDALSDGNIHAVWSTLSRTSKGDMKEKFNIEVTNDKGGKTFKSISGGEKRKVRIATAMALQDMVASRAAKPINLFMADEIDHALDEPGLERLMTVLDKKAKERGTVLVVSHNSLSDWIDSVITIKKTGGISTVSGANERGVIL
ncbi:AAA family ATPase [Undibacterium sp. RTI2.1]|uniref:AAA family ATPase n=1 Tax=unclassified Undibacterium TaxID=2630295 RepID=UPI002B23E6E6|nr:MULTISPECIES: AAA family ATPase [unclassified Undibacterium]MEB0029136.1 AAA family ATPase [Undibacterium sp. RTI2.1]MEB0115444.1 AAA family ATPase [Undibacterium sp. RTI2.2]